jgi:uncharacterized membrane protein
MPRTGMRRQHLPLRTYLPLLPGLVTLAAAIIVANTVRDRHLADMATFAFSLGGVLLFAGVWELLWHWPGRK